MVPVQNDSEVKAKMDSWSRWHTIFFASSLVVCFFEVMYLTVLYGYIGLLIGCTPILVCYLCLRRREKESEKAMLKATPASDMEKAIELLAAEKEQKKTKPLP